MLTIDLLCNAISHAAWGNSYRYQKPCMNRSMNCVTGRSTAQHQHQANWPSQVNNPNKKLQILSALNLFPVIIVGLLLPLTTVMAQSPDAQAIVKASIDHWRGTSSYTVMDMTIHRPQWQRTMRMKGWTLGDNKSLVRVVEPRKDAGNSTLLIDSQMWTFLPKINRIIKIPSSMMSQKWMGSDFSNKDIARSDDIVHQYLHTLIDTETVDGHKVYVIESIPKEDAAVVWGMEVVKVRDDYVLITHAFYDQDMVLVKQLDTLQISEMGGRTIAARQRMIKLEQVEEWTEINMVSAEFDVTIPPTTFTRSNLRNPR